MRKRAETKEDYPSADGKGSIETLGHRVEETEDPTSRVCSRVEREDCAMRAAERGMQQESAPATSSKREETGNGATGVVEWGIGPQHARLSQNTTGGRWK